MDYYKINSPQNNLYEKETIPKKLLSAVTFLEQT